MHSSWGNLGCWDRAAEADDCQNKQTKCNCQRLSNLMLFKMSLDVPGPFEADKRQSIASRKTLDVSSSSDDVSKQWPAATLY